MYTKFNNDKGMTLVELVVVMAIIAVTATIAITSFASYRPHLRLKAAARDIATSLNVARMKAVARNASMTVTFDDGANTFTNNFDPAYTSSGRDWVGKVDIWQGTGVAKYISEPYIINTLDVKDGKVTYNSYGIIADTNLKNDKSEYSIFLKNIPFKAGGEEYRVKINRLTGKVTVQHWFVNKWEE